MQVLTYFLNEINALRDVRELQNFLPFLAFTFVVIRTTYERPKQLLENEDFPRYIIDEYKPSRAFKYTVLATIFSSSISSHLADPTDGIIPR